MSKNTLSKVLRRRHKMRLLTIIIGVAVFAILIQLLVLNNPKQLKAAVMINGSDALIDGGNTTTFVVDQSGNVYQQPAAKFLDDNGNELDFRYYSYLATPVSCGGATCNVKGKNLTVRNGQVLMEGVQSFKNLTIDKSGSVSQPVADRDGMINKPLYTGDFWGEHLTGFLKIPANSIYYLYADTIGGGIEIDVSNKSAISSDNSQNSWSPVYFNSSSDASSWNSGNKLNLTLADYISSNNYLALENATNDFKWVPIRVAYAKSDSAGLLDLKYKLFDRNGFSAQSQSLINQGSMSLDYIYGIADDGSALKNGGQGAFNFEYYVSTDGKTLPNTAFSNSIKTISAKNVALKTAFASNYGYTGGTNNVFQFAYGGNGQANSPIGNSIANVHRVIASRHSAFPANPILFPADVAAWPISFKGIDGVTRRIESGLTLNIDSDITISEEKGINLTGVGYPGWGNEFYQGNLTGLTSAQNRGGGAGGGEMSSTLGGGGSYARKGGDPLATITATTTKSYYGDATEIIGKTAIGSGGGSSGSNVGGSGGGAVKILAKKFNANNKNSIAVNGNGGIIVSAPYNVAGGAGGKVVLKVDELNIGGDTDSSTTKNPIVTADGFGSYRSCSGGSGGYAVIVYNSTNDEVITNKSYSIRFHILGGIGLDQNGNTLTPQNGEEGVVSVIKKSSLESATIKKWLTAIDRPIPNSPPNPNFNPYAVQLNDKIRVNIEVSQMTPGFETTISDAILKVPNSSEKCRPVDGTIMPPNNSLLTGSGFESVGQKVFWTFVPNTGEPILVSYDCQITN